MSDDETIEEDELDEEELDEEELDDDELDDGDEGLGDEFAADEGGDDDEDDDVATPARPSGDDDDDDEDEDDVEADLDADLRSTGVINMVLGAAGSTPVYAMYSGSVLANRLGLRRRSHPTGGRRWCARRRYNGRSRFVQPIRSDPTHPECPRCAFRR